MGLGPLFLPMRVCNIQKRIENPNGRNVINLLLTDNIKICRRKDWEEDSFEACVYIFVKKAPIYNNLGWGIKIWGDIVYYGYTSKFDSNNIFNNRPFKHKNDLLAKILNKNYECYCITGLSENEGKSLEAIFINQSSKDLSKTNAIFLKENHLINKRKESKWKRLANKYLNLENQWK